MVKHTKVKENEPALIAKIARLTGAVRNREIVKGIGDDCAIYRPRGSAADLLFTTDMLIEDVHFRAHSAAPADLGWKTLARGLSDIAAMGGEPRFCLVSLALPPYADARWVDGFYRGLLGLARRENTVLAGGDLSHAAKLACDIVVCGAAPRGKALGRDGARPGDAIYVSGRLGGSALGLESGRGAAWRRHLRPEPRLALGRFLRERAGATSCMDLSDGLSLDLHRLCAASGVAARIGHPPIYRGATLEQALDGGEDYELLFTLPERKKVPEAFDGLSLTRIGTILRGRPGTVEMDGAPLEPRGYDHFRAR